MMDSEQFNRVQDIFEAVVDEPRELQRDLLNRLCLGDENLMNTVQRMIDEDARGSSFLEAGVVAAIHDMDDFHPGNLSTLHFGPYRLVRLLGEGGMGVVYLAQRDDLGSQAAIKILSDGSLSPMRRRRFAEEQRMLANLNHPFIARLYDADTLEDGTPYIVMEYVEGAPLMTYIQERSLGIHDGLRLFCSICEAVQYAHGQAVIHRDLKPSNILVTRDGVIKLLDFGVSKQLAIGDQHDRNTIAMLRPMTPGYASPEQIRGHMVGVQADVYSIGVMLFEFITGRLPFDLSNLTPAQIEQTITENEPKPPSSLGKSIHGRSYSIPRLAWSEIDTLCLTAMHKDRRRRYQSVEALARDLDHFLKSEPLEARPDSLRYRTSKFVERNWRGIAWAAVLILLLSAGTAVAVLRISKAQRDAAAEAARTRQIQLFMLNLFSGGDKQLGPSEDLRVLTVLDRGVQQARMLDQDPETAAELDQTLAGIYENLGKLDSADNLLQSALAKRKRLYGTESPKVAETMTGLGLLRLEQANPDEAERMTRAALSLDQHYLPGDDAAVAKATSALGRVLDEKGSYKDAIPLLERAVSLQSQRPGLEPDLAVSTSELATANYYTGNYVAADSLNRKALNLDEKLYGKLHPRVSDDYVNLGEIQHDLGHDTDAEAYYRKALEIDKSWYGERHPNTAFCMMAIGQSLVFQKRYDEAAPFVQTSLRIQEEVLGPNHPRVAMAFNQAGLLEQRRGRLKDAEYDYTRMAEINRSVYGDKHLLVAIALLNLAQVYLDGHRLALADKSFRDVVERFRAILPPNHPTIGIAEQKLGATLVAERKFREAEKPLLDAFRILNEQTPPATERVAAVRKSLATVNEHLHRTVASHGSLIQPQSARSKEPATHN